MRAASSRRGRRQRGAVHRRSRALGRGSACSRGWCSTLTRDRIFVPQDYYLDPPRASWEEQAVDESPPQDAPLAVESVTTSITRGFFQALGGVIFTMAFYGFLLRKPPR